MKIVFFTDINFEYMAESLIKSLLIQKVDCELVYYTIDFKSTIEYPNLIKKYWKKDITKPRFEYYKPDILLDALDSFDDNDFIFLDSDIIVGKRFDINNLKHNFDFPMTSVGNWDQPFQLEYFEYCKEIRFDEWMLMEYLGVKERSMNYVYSCFMSFNRKCIDFLKEWKSFCNNSYLMEKRKFYYPFHDETSFNVLLWKRRFNKNYGRIYFNTLYFEALKFVEETEEFQGRVFSVPEQYTDNTSYIIFYHGIKDHNELENSLEYLSNNVGGNA